MAGLDRRITINIQAEGEYVRGEFVEGEPTPHSVWASRRDLSQEDTIDAGGQRTEKRRTWRIRWRRDFADMDVQRIGVVDGADTFNVLNFREDTGRDMDVRRRWLVIEGLAVV